VVLVGPLLREVVKQGTRLARQYYSVEGKAFSKLYQGFPQSRTVGRGIRHGLVAGQLAGSFINQGEDSPGNGIQAPFSRKQSPPRKSYQARGGRARGSGYRHKQRCYPYSRRR